MHFTMTRDSEDESSSTKSCFSGILRRILCTGSLPTHPSDSDIVPESDSMILDNKIIQVKGQGTPGVVARLMGLESLPDIKWIPKDAINFRSKSVRSADYFPQFDHLSQESQHRRVKRSVSFREIPTFLHQQNEDLFLVCFDKRDNNNAMGLKMMMTSPDKVVGSQDTKNVKRKSKSVSGNMKERAVVKKKEKHQKKNVQPKRSYSEASNLLPYYNKSNEVYIRSSPRIKKTRPTKPPNSSCDEASGGMKHARMRGNRRTANHARIESSSSSTTGSSSESENSRKLSLNLYHKKYSVPKREKIDYPGPSYSPERSNGRENEEVAEVNQITRSDSLMKSTEIDFYIKNFAKVCRLNEEDTRSCPVWRWIKRETIKSDDSEDICSELEEYIVDMLVQQVVEELC